MFQLQQSSRVADWNNEHFANMKNRDGRSISPADAVRGPEIPLLLSTGLAKIVCLLFSIRCYGKPKELFGQPDTSDNHPFL